MLTRRCPPPPQRRLKAVPLDTDIDGIVPADLRRTLQVAREAALLDGRRPPRVLYTVPTGQNPTGRLILQGTSANAGGLTHL